MNGGGSTTSASSVDNNNMIGNNNNSGLSKNQTMGSAANMSGNNITNQWAATSADQEHSKNDIGNPLTDIGKKSETYLDKEAANKVITITLRTFPNLQDI